MGRLEKIDGLGLRAKVLVLGLVIGVGGAVATHHDPTVDAASPPKGASLKTPPSTAPPTAEQLAKAIKVEAGMTAGKDVTYGVVLENTTDQVLSYIPVIVRFYDAGGKVVDEPQNVFSDPDPSSVNGRIDQLLPGERFGFGGQTARPGATRIEVVVGKPDSWRPGAEEAFHEGATALAPRYTTKTTGVRYGPTNEPIVAFTLTNTGRQSLGDKQVFAILRNRDGRIIGAIDDWPNERVAPGRTRASETTFFAPMEVPGIDPANVEVFVGWFGR